MISVRITVTVCKPSFLFVFLVSVLLAVWENLLSAYYLKQGNSRQKIPKILLSHWYFFLLAFLPKGESIVQPCVYAFRIQELGAHGGMGIIVNIILSILLIGPLQHGGLALAYSIGGIVNLFLLMWALRRRLVHVNIRSILKSSLQTLFGFGDHGDCCMADRLGL